MNNRLKYFLTVVFILSTVVSQATHIIGGYFSYKCLGSISSTEAQFEVTFKMYRDCTDNSPLPPNAAFDNLIPITIFSPSNIVHKVDTFFLGTITPIPSVINNPCVVSSPDICVQEGVYMDTILLPRNQNFELVFQRCCRNKRIDNIPLPEEKGSTFTISIPSFNSIGCNSSPVFNQFPPISLCALFDVNLDLSATDLDGDSLVYTFCAPYDYPNQNNPLPTPAFPPPYVSLLFQGPQTASNPIPSSPQLAIDPVSGFVSGVPTNIGDYVVGFCVEEYRNGILLSTTNRNIQISTGDCSPAIINAVQNQTQLCTGLEVKFTNQSSSSDLDTLFYFWNFGDQSTLADTSLEKDPSYAYPDTGNYTITLIVNPGLTCADTSTIIFRVDSVLNPSILKDGNLCTNENSIDYAVGGVFESSANFEWIFDSQASILTSNQEEVFNVSYPSQGKYFTTLIVTQKHCSDTLVDSVLIYDNPTIDFNYFPKEGCPELTVQFSDLSTVEGSPDYAWDFGTGGVSFDQNPINTYTDTGYYSIGLILFSTTKCIDTLKMIIDSAIRVLPEPIADLQVSDAALPLKEADFRFDATGSQFVDNGRFLINGVEVSPNNVLDYQFSDTGTYKIDYIATNIFDCHDTISQTILVYDEFEFLIPNVFSPNGDGVNEVFAVRACGVYEYEVSIFDRYGINVFKSNSMNINWDGRVDGKAPHSGVFFYTIRIKDFRGEYLNYQGELTLIAN